MKRFFTILILLGVVSGGIYALIQVMPHTQEDPKNKIRTNTAEIRDLESIVPATGEVLPLMSSIVKSEISGRLTIIHVKEGDSVTKGQLLLELDRTSLETRLREAERNLEADRLRLEKAERNFKRLKELYEKQYVGEKEFLDAETDFNLAKLTLEIAQARLEDAAEDLSKTSIIAPHDGIITLIDTVEGQVVSGATSVSNGTELMTVAQLKELYMEANINEVDVENLYTGQLARLRFDAIPNFEIDGKINVIAPSARRDGNIRVFPIEVVFATDDPRVRPGISATIEIPIATAEQTVSVLLSAVFNEDNENYAYVQTLTGWDKRQVATGINNLQYVAIAEGLQADDVVALSRPPQFRNNDE